MANVNNTMLSLARGTTSALAGKTKTDGLLTFDKTKKRVSLDVANGNTIDRIPIDGISLTLSDYNNLSSTEKANGTYYITDTGKIIRDGIAYGGTGDIDTFVLKNQSLNFSKESETETYTATGDTSLTVNKDNVESVHLSTGSVEFYWVKFYYTVDGVSAHSSTYRNNTDVFFQLPSGSDYNITEILISADENTPISVEYTYLEAVPTSHVEISNANIKANSYCSVFFYNSSISNATKAGIIAHAETGKIVFDTALPISNTLYCDIIVENSGLEVSGANLRTLTNAENNYFVYASDEPTGNLIPNKTVWVG